NEIIPTLLPVTLDNQYNGEISVNVDEKQFYVYEKLYDSNQIKISYYDFNGKYLKSLILEDENMNFGMVNNGKSYYYIKTEEPLLNKNNFINSDEILETKNPFSFENVYWECLTNEQANLKNIKQKLKQFFSNAKPYDQVMIF